ncbi:hypothetical protein HGB48_25250 [Actinomadura latina]|uniref:Uncharacterized protein n=2 Tax=Actinomadura latina TaxID=163603 RepID=A0A846Z439_9ACTN|nr:hypothetical protein [Actinomadura latina]
MAERRGALDERAERAPVPDEANEADAAEQRAAIDEADDRVEGAPMPDDANEADVAEQRREVPVDEDDYR